MLRCSSLFFLYQMHGTCAAFAHALHVVFPCDLLSIPQGLELSELRLVIGS